MSKKKNARIKKKSKKDKGFFDFDIVPVKKYKATTPTNIQVVHAIQTMLFWQRIHHFLSPVDNFVSKIFATMNLWIGKPSYYLETFSYKSSLFHALTVPFWLITEAIFLLYRGFEKFCTNLWEAIFFRISDKYFSAKFSTVTSLACWREDGTEFTEALKAIHPDIMNYW